ncbi:parkinson disease protein 7 [Citrus sinensis]|uniref:Parkinson disease protein 7 n=1 Tax=Citrus sinensis TaxID=2711 RepID=A0ACB8LZH6_CITSI|nr:parkinson disease protein 7 [Citrus sinensis]
MGTLEIVRSLRLLTCAQNGILDNFKSNVVAALIEDKLEVPASRRVKLVAGMLIDEAAKLSYDLIFLPGGLGSAKAFAKSDKFGKKAIAFPAMYNKLSDQSEIENMVVVDGNLMQRAKNFHGVCTGNCGEVFWPHQST